MPDASRRRLIEALRRPSCYDHACAAVEVLETHLSWVLLTGPFAYKVKKPVDLGFADFSTLARRRRCCELELRLNRRLAPQLYRDVVTIAGSAEEPRIGGTGPVLEYAVRMAQFPQDALAARQLDLRRLEARHFDALDLDLAAFHRRAPVNRAACGGPLTAAAAARQNFEQLRRLGLPSPGLERWSGNRAAQVAPLLRRRRQAGRVRECHGDLHLGNMVLLDDRLVPFDCIEFNPALRWIDTASEVAFVVMDLLRRGAAAFAHRFLNAYLEASGDYGILQVLDYFLAYRAMVRAKVAAIRASQCVSGTPAHAGALAEARAYVALARGFTRRARPTLTITHGLSGSGKTTITAPLVETGTIRVRSDVERKRLFGLAPAARTGAALDRGIYAAQATARTYALLRRRATQILRAGYGCVVDASFLRRDQRAPFARLARRLACPFRVIALEAPVEVLRARIAARANDASEATAAVLEAQLRIRQPPTRAECPRLTHVNAAAGRRSTLNSSIRTGVQP